MLLTTYEKQRIIFYHREGLTPSQILSALKVEDIATIGRTIARFIVCFQQTGTILRKEGSGRPSKITDRVMRQDDETTATQLHTLLMSSEISVSLSTIIRGRSMLGWTSKYCQLIRELNKIKRHNYLEVLSNGFQDVIWSDETAVQLESHRRHSYRKRGEPATLKPHPKQPIELHVRAGISRRGPAPIAIIEGTVDAEFYISMLRTHLPTP